MKTPVRLLVLTAALFAPSHLRGQEAPPAKTWEIHARLDGGGNPKLAELSRKLLSPVVSSIEPGTDASFHVAGFENPATPGGDWIAERGRHGRNL